MRFLGNTVNPKLATPQDMAVAPGETHQEAFSQWKNWLSDKRIGDPKATDTCSVEELKAMNIVGVYAKD